MILSNLEHFKCKRLNPRECDISPNRIMFEFIKSALTVNIGSNNLNHVLVILCTVKTVLNHPHKD